MKKIIWTLFILLLFITNHSIELTQKKESGQNQSDTIANLLGWRIGKAPTETQCNMCGGYYEEPHIISDVKHPPPYQNTSVRITSQGSVVFRKNGDSILENQIQISQPGRLIEADKAVIRHDTKTKKITTIILFGHVRVIEYGKRLIGKTAVFDMHTGQVKISHAVYRISGKHTLHTVSEPFHAWGTAETIHYQSSSHALDLDKASYTTCSPIHPAWKITAKKIHLNKKTNKGYAKNMVLYFKNIPVLWLPYYSFPLSSARKSGFLSPAFGYATKHGFYFTLPYYWNMAPNYDFLLTPEYYSLRGVLLRNYFRYMTPDFSGSWYASVILHDRQFSKFKTDTLNKFNGVDLSSDLSPYISALRNDSTTRGYVNFENNKQFNAAWSGKLYLRYTTDPYFGNDFTSPFLNQNINQIPSFGRLDYLGEHWRIAFLSQTYQTLHLLTQYLAPAQNQYTRLPEINMNASYPDLFSDFDFDLSLQAVNFDYHSMYYPFTYQRPIGQRFHFRPSISRPWNESWGYVTPQLSVDSTNYFSHLATDNAGVSRETQNVNRALPIFNIDSGLYFDRAVSIGGKQLIQTIEPRFFYLYTPYLNQDRYPNFDTQVLPFSFLDLYTLNRFAGFDRLQNANQLSMGLTSRILRESDAADLLTAQLGVIDYFDYPRVCLLPGCQNRAESISPIVGALTWNPNSIWAMTSQLAWDTTQHQINNGQTGVQFHLDNQHIAVVNYTFTHGNQDTPFSTLGFTTNSSLLSAGLLWPLNQYWHIFGYDYYNLTEKRPETEYAGIAYHTCCWALRFVVQKTYVGTSQINGTIFQNRYDTHYFLELSLMGLGSAQNQSAESLLSSTLPGFEDTFSNRSRYRYNEKLQ